MLIIEVLGLLLSMVLGPLLVQEVQAFGLSQLVNLSTGKANKEFLGELMGDWFA
jgi:hypothetical protein